MYFFYLTVCPSFSLCLSLSNAHDRSPTWRNLESLRVSMDTAGSCPSLSISLEHCVWLGGWTPEAQVFIMVSKQALLRDTPEPLRSCHHQPVTVETAPGLALSIDISLTSSLSFPPCLLTPYPPILSFPLCLLHFPHCFSMSSL